MRHVLLAATLLLGAAAPVLPAGQATPAPHPYDEAADAHAQVAAAFARARLTGRKVLLDFGGNWCPDCRMLAGVLSEPQVGAWTAANFETVLVDVGRFKKNMDIAARWGVTVTAAPTVLVVTPDGKLLNGDDPFGLANARAFSSQTVVDLLAKMAGA
jgi:thiol-disulfide isomerase/thioredoxin